VSRIFAIIFGLDAKFFCLYNPDVNAPKRPPGRPRLGDERKCLSVYGTEEDAELLRLLAKKRGVSASRLVRDYIRAEAARDGLTAVTPPVEPEVSGAAGEPTGKERRRSTGRRRK